MPSTSLVPRPPLTAFFAAMGGKNRPLLAAFFAALEKNAFISTAAKKAVSGGLGMRLAKHYTTT